LLMRNITIVNIKRKKKKIYHNFSAGSFKESLLKFIGRTITIFTASGGKARGVFTGILLSISDDNINLLTELESPPVNPFESRHLDNKKANISLGTIANIPIDKITAFLHNMI
jgi:hypothetical protein